MTDKEPLPKLTACELALFVALYKEVYGRSPPVNSAPVEYAGSLLLSADLAIK